MKQPTTVHKELISEVRAEFFGYATSVVTDRAAAEAATAIIVAPSLKTYEVHWVASPMAGASLWDSLRDSLGASLRASLWDSLRDSLWDSLGASLWDSLMSSLWNSLMSSLWNSLMSSLWNSLRSSLWNSLRSSLGASLGASLRDSLRSSLSDELSSSLSDELRSSLWNSLWDSLWDSGWVAYWTCAVRLTSHTGPDVERLHAFADLARHAFALWVLPGHVIICEKPTAVEVRDGKLSDIQWGGGEQ